MPFPQAKPGLLQHPLDNQVLIYDPSGDTVHLLEPGTACVLGLIQEGGWTGEGIVAELDRRLDLTVDGTYVLAAVEDLRTAGLLDDSEPDQVVDFGRRDFVRKSVVAGASAMLGAAIISLSPTTGDAQTNLCTGQIFSGLPPGSACTADVECCGGPLRKCVEYGGSSAKRCCFFDKGTGKDCVIDPPSGFCCASAPPTYSCVSGTCP